MARPPGPPQNPRLPRNPSRHAGERADAMFRGRGTPDAGAKRDAFINVFVFCFERFWNF